VSSRHALARSHLPRGSRSDLAALCLSDTRALCLFFSHKSFQDRFILSEYEILTAVTKGNQTTGNNPFGSMTLYVKCCWKKPPDGITQVTRAITKSRNLEEIEVRTCICTWLALSKTKNCFHMQEKVPEQHFFRVQQYFDVKTFWLVSCDEKKFLNRPSCFYCFFQVKKSKF